MCDVVHFTFVGESRRILTASVDIIYLMLQSPDCFFRSICTFHSSISYGWVKRVLSWWLISQLRMCISSKSPDCAWIFQNEIIQILPKQDRTMNRFTHHRYPNTKSVIFPPTPLLLAWLRILRCCYSQSCFHYQGFHLHTINPHIYTHHPHHNYEKCPPLLVLSFPILKLKAHPLLSILGPARVLVFLHRAAFATLRESSLLLAHVCLL